MADLTNSSSGDAASGAAEQRSTKVSVTTEAVIERRIISEMARTRRGGRYGLALHSSFQSGGLYTHWTSEDVEQFLEANDSFVFEQFVLKQNCTQLARCQRCEHAAQRGIGGISYGPE